MIRAEALNSAGAETSGSGLVQAPTSNLQTVAVVFEYAPSDTPGDQALDENNGRRNLCHPSCRRLKCPFLLRTSLRFRAWAEGIGVSGSWVSGVICPLLLGLQLWALGYCFLGKQVSPGGDLFRLAVMFLGAEVAGWLVQQVAGMPALVGMLVVGVAMRSTGCFSPSRSTVGLIDALRKVALVLIMIRAGLGLDPQMLRSVSLLVVGLATLPAAVEVATISVTSYLLLDLPWLWGVLLGVVLAAVAPSVVMPCFMELRSQRLGTDQGIDTLVIAAASFDDVIFISIFGVIQSLIFLGGTSIEDLVQPPLGLVFGILFGIVWGKVLQIIPTRGACHLSMWRFLLTVGGGLVVTFGSIALGYSEAGPVGCITIAFVAAMGWRVQDLASVEKVDSRFAVMWAVFEPIMFSLIGADVDTGILDGGLVGLGIACLVISLTARVLTTWLMLFGAANWNWKERLFVALAWLPKADVQAALGPLALDAARKAHLELGEARATTVLLVAVLAIITTAPAGAALISALGKSLLTQAAPPPPPTPRHGHGHGLVLEGGTLRAD